MKDAGLDWLRTRRRDVLIENINAAVCLADINCGMSMILSRRPERGNYGAGQNLSITFHGFALAPEMGWWQAWTYFLDIRYALAAQVVAACELRRWHGIKWLQR